MKLQNKQTVYSPGCILDFLVPLEDASTIDSHHEATIRLVLAMPTEQHTRSANSSESEKSAVISDALEQSKWRGHTIRVCVRNARIVYMLIFLPMASFLHLLHAQRHLLTLLTSKFILFITPSRCIILPTHYNLVRSIS